MLLTLELLKDDNKHLPQTPYNTRHRIRQLPNFRMIHKSDLVCRQNTTVVGLSSTKIVDVEEMVAMFLHVLAHDVKNRIIQREFVRLSETNCLGPLDRSYIKVNVSAANRPTFRTREGKLPQMYWVFVTRKGISYTSSSDRKDLQQTRGFYEMFLHKKTNSKGQRYDNLVPCAKACMNQEGGGHSCRLHLAVKGLLNKSFSYYNELAYMFGHDRTMSHFAETFAYIGMPELTSLDRELLQRHLLSCMDDMRGFVQMPDDERQTFWRVLLRDISR
uniref:DUF8040 domain-containing protein n=1 Tax=Cucumis melo TaxID=3656 RepID=A0A9I9EKC7_CUCME